MLFLPSRFRKVVGKPFHQLLKLGTINVTNFINYLESLRNDVEEISCHAAAERLEHESILVIDIRDQEELHQGVIINSRHISRSVLEMKIGSVAASAEEPMIIYCGSGVRSLLAAKALGDLGYKNVLSLAGGFQQWRQLGLAVSKTEDALSTQQRDRYRRHLLIPEIGEAGQIKLLKSRVLIVGVGGLGSPAALYLAAAGVGTLGIIDDDVVDRSNLQRQVLHKERDIGGPKTSSARESILSINPEVKVEVYPQRLTQDNVDAIFANYDVIVDGSDNFASRYLINDACVRLKRPNVHGAIFRFEGQASVFWVGNPKYKSPCYRCLFPEAPPVEQRQSCAEAGVIGTLPGVVGLLEAMETLKLLLAIGSPLIGRLVLYDGLAGRFKEIKLNPDPSCSTCGSTR